MLQVRWPRSSCQVRHNFLSSHNELTPSTEIALLLVVLRAASVVVATNEVAAIKEEEAAPAVKAATTAADKVTWPGIATKADP